MLRLVCGLCLAAIIAGCVPTPAHVNERDAQAIVNSLVYVRNAQHDLCFGVSGVGGTIHANGSYVVVNVPCEKVQDSIQ